jgi:hypothetical protein
MKVILSTVIAFLLLLSQSWGQTRFYFEALGGGNISLSRMGTQSPAPGLRKYNETGPFYGLLAGHRIGTYLYLESGIIKPLLSVKFRLQAPSGGDDYTRSYRPHVFLFPLLVRKNFSLRRQKFFIRLGGAFNRMSPDSFPDEFTNWPSADAVAGYRKYDGSDIYVCLLSGIGYSKVIRTKRIERLGEISISMMYGQGLTEVIGQFIDYSFDGVTYFTRNIQSKGSFVSAQLGLRLYTAYYKRPARHPWPARKEIN